MGNTESFDSKDSGLVSYINGETTHHGIVSSNYREITIQDSSDSWTEGLKGLRPDRSGNGVLVVKGYKTSSMERPPKNSTHRFKILHSGEIKSLDPKSKAPSYPFETAFVIVAKNKGHQSFVVGKEKGTEPKYHIFGLQTERSIASNPTSFFLHELDKSHIHSVEIKEDMATKTLVLKTRQYMYSFTL